MDEDLKRLRAAFDTMPQDQRVVFERARFAGESYGAIAAELGIDCAEVERRMALAIAHMTRALDP
jgi:RNA polymerase sigma factor (sigma-70 family)